jgi:hypothetical protein
MTGRHTGGHFLRSAPVARRVVPPILWIRCLRRPLVLTSISHTSLTVGSPPFTLTLIGYRIPEQNNSLRLPSGFTEGRDSHDDSSASLKTSGLTRVSGAGGGPFRSSTPGTARQCVPSPKSCPRDVPLEPSFRVFAERRWSACVSMRRASDPAFRRLSPIP